MFVVLGSKLFFNERTRPGKRKERRIRRKVPTFNACLRRKAGKYSSTFIHQWTMAIWKSGLNRSPLSLFSEDYKRPWGENLQRKLQSEILNRERARSSNKTGEWKVYHAGKVYWKLSALLVRQLKSVVTDKHWCLPVAEKKKKSSKNLLKTIRYVSNFYWMITWILTSPIFPHHC